MALLIATSIFEKSLHFVFYENREYEVQVKNNTIHLMENIPYHLQLELKEHFNVSDIVIHKQPPNQRIAESLDCGITR